MPVASYAPEMLALYRAAAKEAKTIKGLTYGQAIHFRHRMNRLRREMRKENHPLLPAAECCILRLLKPHPDTAAPIAQRARDAEEVELLIKDAPIWSVLIEPADRDIAKYITEAGVELSDEDFLIDPPSGPAPDLSGRRPQTPNEIADSDVAAAVDKFLKEEN